MAESSKTDESTERPGIGMRLTIAGLNKKFPSVKNLTTQALAALLDTSKNNDTTNETKEKVLIIDARPEVEYNVSHIQDARRVDFEADGEVIMNSVPELLTPDVKTTVVCYCSVGYRSSIVAEKIASQMKNKGVQYTNKVNVYNLEGSIFKWANENRPMVDMNDKTTKNAHPFNALFGKLLNKELRQSSPQTHD